ncbi:hypothetical protein JKF63_04752 [Porcisia hertigi]|uniref:Uncharacterized protein n=1 Tax=Porcisia hertigi TaxID=2761500 RepID=A0A836I150_9TRYP|nr:hypothetical protein JKF63_04752 [Porcisia hertigi]
MASAKTKVAEEPKVSSWTAKLVGDAAVTYSTAISNVLTDFAGIFLVLCGSVYFTIGGYLFYRELVLSK